MTDPAKPTGAGDWEDAWNPSGSATERWIGKFRIIRELGRGGMGIVYLAEDPPLNRRLAVKVLPRSVAAEERVVQRFLREAQAAARLRHRNIIPIFSAGNLEGTYYYSMEYIPGVTMGQIVRSLRERKLSHRGTLVVQRFNDEGQPALRLVQDSRPSSAIARAGMISDAGEEVLVSFAQHNYVHEALKLFVEVAEALHYAHGQGVVHRDVKPSNLLLAPDGRLMVADFGLAKIGDQRSITKTGDLLGSPSYMSPEQTMTRRVPVDHRTDIWSLGVTLYEFLTLRHPFEARSLEVSLRNITSQEPHSPRKFNPRLPKDVETILLKTLEKNPDRRYQTAGELADDLRCVLNYESIQARSAGPVTRSVRFVRRNSTPISLSALSIALIITIVSVFMLRREQKLQDLEQGISYFRGYASSQPNGVADEATITEIQESLRVLRKKTDTLENAIDQYSIQTLYEAEKSLPGTDGPGNLGEVVRSLVKLRVVLLHNPNAEERLRLERVDRATAEIRVQLVWAIHDKLAAVSKPANAEQLWTWLCHFLGKTYVTDGVPKERNALVQRNAITALGFLAQRADYRQRALEPLRIVIQNDELEPEVQCEAVKALASVQGVGEDEASLHVLETLVESDTHFLLPPLSRYKAAEVLLGSPDRSQYGKTFRRLLGDPAIAVQDLADQALRVLEENS